MGHSEMEIYRWLYPVLVFNSKYTEIQGMLCHTGVWVCICVYFFRGKCPTHLKQEICGQNGRVSHGKCHESFWLSRKINKFAGAISDASVEMQ